MKYIKVFENIFRDKIRNQSGKASYKRTNDAHSKFYSAKELAPSTTSNLKKREDVINKVKENINDSIKAIEKMPVTNWYEEPIDILNSLYSLKEWFDENNID